MFSPKTLGQLSFVQCSISILPLLQPLAYRAAYIAAMLLPRHTNRDACTNTFLPLQEEYCLSERIFHS